MQKKLNVVTALLLILMSLMASSCATSGVKETKLVVLEITAYQDVKLNLTYHQKRSYAGDYSAKLLWEFPLNQYEHRTIAFVTTEDGNSEKEGYSGTISSQYSSFKNFKINYSDTVNYREDELKSSRHGTLMLSIKRSKRTIPLSTSYKSPSYLMSKELIIYKMPGTKKKVTVKPMGGTCAEAQPYLVCKRANLPKHIALLNSEDNTLIAFYSKTALPKFYENKKYFPKLLAQRQQKPLNIPKEVRESASAFKFKYTIYDSTYSIGTSDEENQWKLLVPGNVEPSKIKLGEIEDKKLSLLNPKLDWDSSEEKFSINTQFSSPYIRLTKDEKIILEAELNSLNNKKSEYMDQTALDHLSKELTSWVKDNNKTKINNIKARFARETQLTPEIVKDQDGNKITTLSLDKMNWYHSHFSLLSSDPVERPMVNPAGWTLRKTEKSDAQVLATLDAYGKLTTFELHKLLGGESSKIFYLHPKADSENVLLKPVKIHIKATKLSSSWDYEYPVQQTKSLTRTFSPQDFAGFAPIVEIEMKDGTSVKLIVETDARYKKKPNQTIVTNKIDLELDRVSAITPIGLSSFGRTELQADNLNAFLDALDHKRVVEKWQEFFRSHQAGLDVYTEDSNATVVIRHLDPQNGESAYEFLPQNPVSSKYRSLSGVIREDVELWNGQEWKKLTKNVPGHYYYEATKSKTLYILLSAVSLEPSNSASAGESSYNSVVNVPLADDDPLDFLDEDEPSENETVQISKGESQSSVDNVGRFIALWKKSAVSLADLLKKNKGITTCQVFVVFTDAKKHRFEKLATIDLTESGFNYQQQMSDQVSKKFHQYSNDFRNSMTLSRRTSTLVRLFAEYLSNTLHLGNTLLPNSKLLFIALEGEQIKAQKSSIQNSLFRTREIVGFLKAESKSDIVPVFEEALK